MDLLHWIERIFSEFGYFVLIVGLPLDFIALPIPPATTTITVTGYLVNRGVLGSIPAFAAAFLGSAIGITITYTIGYQAGYPLLNRFKKRKGKKTAALSKVEQWHERYGLKMMLLSFFIPIVRQFYSYYMGIVRVPFRKFALYGYTGAAIWVTVFFMIGYSFAEQWQVILTLIGENITFLTILLLVLIGATVVYKHRFRFISAIRNFASKEIEFKIPKFIRTLFRMKVRTKDRK